MVNFWERNKNFFAIIAGAIIIGGFLFFAVKNQNIVVAPAPQIPAQKFSAQPKLSAKISAQPQTQTQNLSAATCEASANTIITKVIDGDTVVVEGGWHVRLLGMDADEKGYPCYDPAKTRLEDLILSKNVVLEKDVSDVDQYGRCLRYIFLENKNIDTQLVAEGLAVARFYAPDLKYRAEITAAELYAQQNKIGCKWSGIIQTAP